MRYIIEKPYMIFWIFIPVILILGAFGWDNSMDIQYHATYYVISVEYTVITFMITSGLLSLVYYLIGRRTLISWMTIGHVIATIISFLALLIINILFQSLIKDPSAFRRLNKIVYLLLFIISFSQIIFLVNVILALIRNNKK